MNRAALVLGIVVGIAPPLATGAQTSAPDSIEVRLTRTLTTAGRVRLAEVRFAARGDRLEASVTPLLQHVARVMAGLPGSFLIEAHTASSGDPTADQVITDRRASAVRARLVELGVPAARLFAVGLGSTKAPPPSPGAPPSAADLERVEISRLQ